MTGTISQMYEEVPIEYIAGDALRFKATIRQRDPDDPGPDDAPNMIPYPLDGFTVAAQIRKSLKKDALLIATFIVEIDEDDSNVIWAYLPPDQSELLRGIAEAVWDLQITDDNGDPRTIMGGTVTPKGDSTRD